MPDRFNRGSTAFVGKYHMQMEDKTAIITGGGRGIGRAIALAFAKEGANIVPVARTESEIEKVAQEAQSLGVEALPLPADVSEESDVYGMVERTMDVFGRIDVLVNSAGAIFRETLKDTTVSQWDKTMAVNVRGTFLCSKAVIEAMMEQKSGHIINISSVAGKIGFPKRTAYCASKFAVVGFTHSLSEEVKEFDIKVNVICPAVVATEMSKGGFPDEDWSEWMDPEDIAHAALFLAVQSPKAVTVEVLVDNIKPVGVVAASR